MIRNTVVKPSRRRYASALREDQAEATRTRILEALVRTMAAGMAGLSIPAVAREAGVSIPTIYRHFGSKTGLIAALNPYVVKKGGMVPETLPQSIDDLGPMVRRLFRNLESMDQTLRAAMASELGHQTRRAMMPERRAMIRDALGRLAPDISDAELGRLADLALILMSSPAFWAYKDYLGLSPDAAAGLTSWAIGTLIAGARPIGGGSS
jgi:AcrR family transcriptional regulator